MAENPSTIKSYVKGLLNPHIKSLSDGFNNLTNSVNSTFIDRGLLDNSVSYSGDLNKIVIPGNYITNLGCTNTPGEEAIPATKQYYLQQQGRNASVGIYQKVTLTIEPHTQYHRVKLTESTWSVWFDNSGSISPSSITTNKLKDGSVTTSKILNGTILGEDIAAGTITNDKLAEATNLGLPAGSKAEFYMSAVPSGYLVCDGSSIKKTVYVALFAAIGAKYGSTTTHFSIPDNRNDFTRGAGNPSSVGTKQGHLYGSHNHGIDSAGSSWSDITQLIEGSGPRTGGMGNDYRFLRKIRISTSHSHSISSSGGSETRPRNMQTLYCIKY